MHTGYIWAAVSSSPQVKNVSLDAQLADALQFADRFHVQVVGLLVVPGRSRYITLFDRAAQTVDGLHIVGNAVAYAAQHGLEKIIERVVGNGETIPGVEVVFVYAKLLELVEAHQLNVLFFLNRSRIGRKAALSITVADLCAENGVKLFDMESPPSSLSVNISHDEQLIGAVKSVGFERDIRDLIDKTKNGLVRRVENGLFVNRVPWGYSRVFDSAGQVVGYTLDPQVREIVLLFVKMYLDGHGQESIAAEFDRRGFITPSPGRWNHEKVRGLLQKTWAYAGYSEINRKSLSGRQYFRAKGIWEPIFDEETAQRILAEQKSRIRKPKSISNPYRFSRCVICDICGRSMAAKRLAWRSSSKPGAAMGYRHQYRCVVHGFVSEKKIERAMIKFIERLNDDNFRADLADLPQSNELEQIVQRIEMLQNEVDRRKAGIAKADDDYYLSGTLDEDRYRALVSAAKKQIDNALIEITSLQDRLSQLENDTKRGERIEQVRNAGAELLMNPDVRVANAWIRQHFRIYVRDSQVKDIIIL